MSETSEPVDNHAADAATDANAAIRARGLDRLMAPPRRVALPVRCQLMFGGFLSQFGWFFFAFGMIFFWGFAMNADIRLLGPNGGWKTAQGVVTAVESTNSSENKTRIFRIRYTFKPAKGGEIEGVSYSLGASHLTGNAVTVEYASGNPVDSRILGQRQRMFSGFVLFVVIFPLIGFIMLNIGFARGRKRIKVLSEGILGEAELVSKVATNTEINNQRVYKLTFEFDAIDGQTHQATASTHLPQKLEDEAKELLFYDPLNPDRAQMLDELNTSFKVDEAGDIQPESSRAALLSMVVPTIAVLGHGTYLLYALLF